MPKETWLDQHLEEFVRPVLKTIPNVSESVRTQWPVNQLIALQATWEQAKRRAGGRKILLPGRDVFLFEVLARLDGTDTLFRADFSRNVCAHAKCLFPDEFPLFKDYYVLDTGFSGSVPRYLEAEVWDLVSFKPDYSDDLTKKERLSHQVFPHARQRSELLKIADRLEGVPKYWGPGAIKVDREGDGKHHCTLKKQSIDSTHFFSSAVEHTILVASWQLECPLKPRTFEQISKESRCPSKSSFSKTKSTNLLETPYCLSSKGIRSRLRRAASMVKRSLTRKKGTTSSF